ncbi:MAG: archaeosortase/exosortase family protein [Weeksellaceae bacterium]
MSNIHAILKRTVVYFALFVIIFGLLGSWIIGSKLLSQGDFWIYGDKGKLVILMALLFPFIIREKIKLLPKATWGKTNIFFGFATIASVGGFTIAASRLLASLPLKPIEYYLTSHVLLILTPILLALTVFGTTFLVKLAQIYKKEFVQLGIIGIVLYIATDYVWQLWPYLSDMVLHTVAKIFALSYHATVSDPQILTVADFKVQVGEACSGLESLFMFSALYGLIGHYEWKNIKHRAYLLTFIPLAIGLYLVNILRVYLIVLIGVEWSADIAIRLFHTYLGMVFFVIYFLGFLRFIYPRLKKV